jgi:hypothetical protein
MRLSALSLTVALLAFTAATAQDTLHADTSINVDAPYAHGELWMAVGNICACDSRYPTLCQSVSFSSGVTAALSFSAGSLEDPSLYIKMLFGGPALNATGYGWRDSMVTVLGTGGRYTTGSDDTVWGASASYPDSLRAMDTLVCRSGAGGDTAVRMPGRWCFTNFSCFEYCIVAGFAAAEVEPQYNTVMYARSTNGRTMELQVGSYRIDTTSFTPPAFTRIGAFLLRWAADSAGNGLYLHDGTAAERTPPAVRALRVNMHADTRSFSLMGQRLHARSLPGAARASVRVRAGVRGRPTLSIGQ